MQGNRLNNYFFLANIKSCVFFLNTSISKKKWMWGVIFYLEYGTSSLGGICFSFRWDIRLKWNTQVKYCNPLQTVKSRVINSNIWPMVFDHLYLKETQIEQIVDKCQGLINSGSFKVFRVKVFRNLKKTPKFKNFKNWNWVLFDDCL